MALIDKASLLMVPSTYEAGKLYNVLPSGNRAPDNKGGAGYDQTRADFDFDRGSNAAASRINSSGLIEKYRENLLLQSNNFGTTWGTDSSTITSGQSGYDGSSDAWLLSRTGANGRFGQVISLNGLYTFSLYVKAGTKSFVKFGSSSGNVEAYFNLSNGSITSSGSLIIEAKTTDVGNGWYRCQMTFSATLSYLNIWIADSNGNTTGTTGSILIQSAQLESGLVATEYLNSTSVTAKAGVLVDLPRINYDANGENGALLLEPSRANIITNSEYLGGSDWIKSGNGASSVPIITSNAAISPEGVQNATRVDLDLNGGTSSGDWSWVYQNFTSTGNDETFSMYIKAVDASNVGKVIAFGAVSFTAQSLTADWVRIESTSSAAVGGYGNGFRLRGTEGTSNTASFYVFGIQHEQNASYATSYIPNHSGTGGVTRAADVCTGGGSAESINSVEGVLYAEIAALSNDGTYRLMNLIDDSNNDNFIYLGYKDSSNTIRTRIEVGGAASTDMEFVLSNETEFNKIAVKWKTNDFALWVNGIEVATDSSGVSFTANTLDKIDFDRNGNLELNANVKQLAVFNEALTDSELATLTTL